MADTPVFITGAADGAFTQALSELPAWATENTAAKIESILEKTLNLQTKTLTQLVKNSGTGSGKSPEQQKKLNDELDKTIKNLKKTNDEYPKEKRRNKEKEDHYVKEKKSWKDGVENLLGFRLSLADAGLAVKQAFTDSIGTFDELYSSGIDLVSEFDKASNGLQALQQMAQVSGIRYTELAKTIEKYSTAVNAFGVGKFTKTFSGASAQLVNFGYNTKQAADLLGAYLESQRGYADVNSKSQTEVQKDLVNFGERITRLSQATGIMRTKLLEDIQAISQSVEANILAGQVGADAADSTLEFIASFKNKDVGQAFLRMMTDAIKPLNDTFIDFQKTGFGGFGQELMNFTQSLEGLNPEEAQKRTADFAKAHDQELKVMIQRGNLLRSAGVKEADGMLRMATGLQQQGRSYKAVTDADKKKLDATSSTTKSLENAQERLQSQWQQAFAPPLAMLDAFTFALTNANQAIEGFAGLFSGTVLGWVGLGIIVISAFTTFSGILKFAGTSLGEIAGMFGRFAMFAIRMLLTPFKLIGSVFGYIFRFGSFIFELLSPISKLVLAFTAGWTIGTVINDIIEKFGLFTGFFDTVFSAFDKVVDWIKAIGEGIANSSLVKWLFGSKTAEATTPAQRQSILSNAGVPIAPAKGEITVPKNPKSSTIDSPSAVSTDKNVGGDQAPQKESTKPSGVGTEKPVPNSGINTQLAYQNSLLEQILQKSDSLLSVNKDILKYAKVST